MVAQAATMRHGICFRDSQGAPRSAESSLSPSLSLKTVSKHSDMGSTIWSHSESQYITTVKSKYKVNKDKAYLACELQSSPINHLK